MDPNVQSRIKQVVEDLRKYLEQLPKTDRGDMLGLTEEQAELLRLLAVVLTTFLGGEAAKGVMVSLGEEAFLKDLTAGQSLLLTSDSLDAQFEIKRLGEVKTPGRALMCKWCIINNIPRCCLFYSKP